MAATTGTGEPVDAVEQLERLLHHLGDLGLGVEALELPDVGAGDEARSLPLISTRPLTSPRARLSSTALTISPSSSVGPRPSEFMLSPLRSMIAQAMPSKSTVKRQSCKSGSVVAMGWATQRQYVRAWVTDCVPPAGGRRLIARELGGGKIVDGDDARHEIAQLGERARLGRGEHALGLRVGDPVAVVEAPHLALADRAFELLVGLLARHDLGERVVEQPDRSAGSSEMKMSRVRRSRNAPGCERRAHDLCLPSPSVAGARRVPKGKTSAAISHAAQRTGKLRKTPSSAWSKR